MTSLTTDGVRVIIGGKAYLKSDVYAQEINEGFRFYSKDPLYPITPYLNIRNTVDGAGNPFANFAALKSWVAANVNALAIPAPPDSGTFVLTATDGVISWEAGA
ncbi:hypothetical protein [Parapedobacter lycopersici]|uniref:hypothetical protein n=1 Tax=Parapedobacter lycopersici TaxID=1864939 RepID=UPI00214D3932|nr:hypothetical protein [Parapedobacter lycopersici]